MPSPCQPVLTVPAAPGLASAATTVSAGPVNTPQGPLNLVLAENDDSTATIGTAYNVDPVDGPVMAVQSTGWRDDH